MTLRHSLSILPFALLLSACGDSYDTNLPPPKSEATFKEILPAEIGGEAVKGELLPLDKASYHGIKASYGTSASIIVLQCGTQEALDDYVKGTAVPLLEPFSTRASGKFNGVWSLKASGKNGRIRGWQNSNWFFLIETADDALFDEVVEKFPYIQKK